MVVIVTFFFKPIQGGGEIPTYFAFHRSNGMGAKNRLHLVYHGEEEGEKQEKGRVHKKLQQELQNGSKEISPSSNVRHMFLVATTPSIGQQSNGEGLLHPASLLPRPARAYCRVDAFRRHSMNHWPGCSSHGHSFFLPPFEFFDDPSRE